LADYLTKTQLLHWRQCPRRLWLEVRGRVPAQAGAALPLLHGRQVGEAARGLFPGGRLIDTAAPEAALARTRAALAAGEPLYEAAFLHEGLLARADLLLPQAEGWRLVEVKAATGLKPEHAEECAIQAWVLAGCGIALKSAELAHVDGKYVYPGGADYTGLLQYRDLRADAARLAPLVPQWLAGARATLTADEPDITVGPQCGKPSPCPYRAHCAPPRPDYPLSILPHAEKLAKQLAAQGIADLRDVPEAALTKPMHRRIWQATREGRAVLDGDAGERLRQLAWPRHYLDFEAVQFAVPRWAGTRPYQFVPFQWSCHREAADGDLEHLEFLDLGGGDPRRAFAEALLAAAGEAGPVLVYYKPFEQGRIHELAEDFPDLGAGLRALGQRLVDLLPIAQRHYYHPAMKGSWSLKAVLPTIAPDLAYARLEQVRDGGDAQLAYLECVTPDTPPERRATLARALLTYCGRDTLALVRLARHFQTGATPESSGMAP
jgi:hypothetical protein